MWFDPETPMRVEPLPSFGDWTEEEVVAILSALEDLPPEEPVKAPAIHRRLRVAKGKAKLHTCVDCGGLAAEWSYDHADPDEIPGCAGYPHPYSLDLEHYDPRCHRCHRRFDMGLPLR